MSDTSGQIDPDRSVGQGPGESQVPEPAPRKRRGLRITLVSLASLVVFLGAVAVGGYLLVRRWSNLPTCRSTTTRGSILLASPTSSTS